MGIEYFPNRDNATLHAGCGRDGYGGGSRGEIGPAGRCVLPDRGLGRRQNHVRPRLSARPGYRGRDPTFNLLLTYDTAPGTVWHFDLYRLGSPDEVIELGLEDAFADGICLIEWPDRLGPWLPEARIEIHLTDSDDGVGRWLELCATGPGAERWQGPW